MKHLFTAMVIALGMSGGAGAQEGREKPREGKAEPSVTYKQADTDGDGNLTIKELQAALEKLMQRKVAGDKRESGEKRESGGKREDVERKRE